MSMRQFTTITSGGASIQACKHPAVVTENEYDSTILKMNHNAQTRGSFENYSIDVIIQASTEILEQDQLLTWGSREIQELKCIHAPHVRSLLLSRLNGPSSIAILFNSQLRLQELESI